jgi:hypothetical protein
MDIVSGKVHNEKHEKALSPIELIDLWQQHKHKWTFSQASDMKKESAVLDDQIGETVKIEVQADAVPPSTLSQATGAPPFERSATPPNAVNTFATVAVMKIREVYICMASLIKSNQDVDRSSGAEIVRQFKPILNSRGASFVKQVYLCHNRALLQQQRTSKAFALELGVAGLAGGLMGLAVNGQSGELYHGIYISPYSLISPSPLNWLVPMVAMLIGMAVGLAVSNHVAAYCCRGFAKSNLSNAGSASGSKDI